MTGKCFNSKCFWNQIDLRIFCKNCAEYKQIHSFGSMNTGIKCKPCKPTFPECENCEYSRMVGKEEIALVTDIDVGSKKEETKCKN